VHGAWPWILMALLGAYHGINPAMGWLFAVNLGLQDGGRRSVLRALPPIALGHEAAIALVVGLVLVLGVVADPAALRVGAAVVLIAFGVFRFARPRAHPRWTRARVSGRELTLWSFLMSSAHGAGLMVAPVLIGAGAADARAQDHALADMRLDVLSVPESALALALHVGAMLLVMGVVAVTVYELWGVRILRSAWLNTEALWAGAFVVAGVVTLLS
jgi:hypothetical protein